MDLGAWASGEYAIPGGALEAPQTEGEDVTPALQYRDETRH